MAATVGGFGGEHGPRQCTAISKRSGKQCQGPAIVNSQGQKCRMHGGKADAQIGTANTQFKHGRHSRYLPSDLDKLYREALANPDLLEMADHIALLEARMQDILGKQSAGEPVPKWSDIADIFGEVEVAILTADMAKVVPGLERMHKVLEAGIQWDSTWDQVSGIMEQLRKLTDTEVKRKKELNQMVPIERVIVLMAAVGEAVKRNVTDPLQIEAVYKELTLLHSSNRTPNGDRKKFAPTIIDVNPRKSKRLAVANAVDVDAAPTSEA